MEPIEFTNDTIWMTMDPTPFPGIHNNNVMRTGKSFLPVQVSLNLSFNQGLKFTMKHKL